MLENQFIQINYSTMQEAALKEPVVLPKKVVNYSPDENSRMYIYIPGDVVFLSLLDEDGTDLKTFSFTSQTDYRLVNIAYLIYEANSMSTLTLGARYFIRTIKGTTYKYSNPVFIATVDDGLSHIRYKCDEEAFGFPFAANEYVSMYLPIRLHSPQNVQDDKTYVKANGNVVTLFAKYYKEWEGETEYLSEEMHDKIVAALSCDNVYINGKRVTKTDKYQVDWENYDIDCDGVTKLAKATFKVREHITQRNSNY